MAVREILAYFGVETDDSELKKLDTSIDSTKKLLGDLGKALAVKAIVSGVSSFVSEMVDLGTSIKQATQKTGLSAQQWQQWTYAADVAGVSSEQLGTAFRMLFKNAEGAAEGGKSASKVFSSLGIDVKDSSGHLKDSNQLFIETTRALAAIQNPGERSAAAMKVFGRSGTALIPLLEQGPEALAALSDRFAELGGGVTDDALAKIGETRKATADWELAMTGLKSTVSTEVLPAITYLVTKGADFIAMVSKATRWSHLFQAALIVLAVASTALAVPLIAPWLPFIEIAGAAILLLDLLLSIFEGGDSIVGSFFKTIERSKWFQRIEDGVGRAKRAFLSLGAAIKDEVASWGGKILDGLSAAWDTVVDFFTTKGAQIWDGFIEGLERGWDKVVDWFKAHIPGLEGLMNSLQQSHSPARIAIDPGENFIGGYALGMQNMIPTVKKQAAGAVDAGLDGLGSSPMINNNLFTPSVGPSRSTSTVNHVRQHNDISQAFHGVAPGAQSDLMRSSMLGVASDDRRAMMADLEALGGDNGD